MHSLSKEQKLENYIELLEQKQKKLDRLNIEVTNLKKKITLLRQTETTRTTSTTNSALDLARNIVR